MKGGSRVALAAAGGYLIGRSRKMRWVALLGGAAVSGKVLSGGQGELLQKAAQALSSSPELKDVADVRSRLVEAGKGAAVTATSNRINAISDSLHERSESLQSSGAEKRQGTAGGSAAEGQSPDQQPEAERDASEGPARTGAGEASKTTRSRQRSSATQKQPRAKGSGEGGSSTRSGSTRSGGTRSGGTRSSGTPSSGASTRSRSRTSGTSGNSRG